jgi:PAS domain S-box-containing protein
MVLVDMRTVILSYSISNALCAALMILLWFQNHRHFPGLGFWVADFALQFVGIGLVALRGTIPFFVSTVVGNMLLIGGTIFLYMGLERFVGKPGKQIHNAILLAIFTLSHTWFTLIQPSLAARNANLALGLLVLCAQAAWLTLHRVDAKMRAITRGVGIVMVAFCVLSTIRIVVELTVPSGNDFFHSEIHETLVVLIYQMLFIILTFSLALMVNHRLFADLEQDSAERKHTEDALRISEEKFAKAFHSSPDAILITRLSDGTITEVNEGFTRIAEYSHEEALSGSSIGLGLWVNSLDREQCLSDLEKDRAVHDREYDFRTKTGRIINGLYSGAMILLGNEPHILSVVRDITERRQAAEIVQLRLRLWEYAAKHTVNELMQKALDEIGELTTSPIGFYHFVEPDQNTLSLQVWSTRTMQEFCQAEGQGMHYSINEAGVWVDCIRERKPVIHNSYAALSYRKGMPAGHAEVVRELVVPTMRNGLIVSVLGVGNKASDYDKKDIEFVAYVADIVWSIVERKRAEEALQKTNAELQSRNEELDAFGHTVAHDLKNPLSNIISFTYLLEDRENPLSEEEAVQMVQSIKQMGFKMDSIIDELMLLAGLRKAEVKMEPLNMDRVIADSLGRLNPLIEESHAKIVYPASWPMAVGYAPWVEEVWVNYVSNAIKYGGRPPRVELGTKQEDKAIRFWVQDNGAGLAPTAQTRLFTPFERLNQTHLSGYGLGLSIVERIVTRMGGQVGVQSAGVPGEGSTFSFTLPCV